MFTFLHAADLHLDSPLRGLERYPGAPVERIRTATRGALKNLVDLALNEQVDFVLIAGDVYDGDWEDYNTGLHFIEQMARLRPANIRVFLIAGNHDAQSKMTRSLALPDNVHSFPTSEPGTVRLDDFGVALHGQGFATAAVQKDLSSDYPRAEPGYFNVGMLHTSADGREGHARYAPCSVAGLVSKGYDYWALGHVHQREILQQEPWIVFSGNLQGRHIRETGPKGCTLVTVDDRKCAQIEARWLDVLRWETCRVDASGADDADAVLDRLAGSLQDLCHTAEGRPLAVRVELCGATGGHEELVARQAHWTQQVRATAAGLGTESVWIEKVCIRTSLPLDDRRSDLVDGAVGDLMQFLDELQSDEAQLARLAKELADFRKKLPPELTEGSDSLGFDQPAVMREALEQVRPLLRRRILGEVPA